GIFRVPVDRGLRSGRSLHSLSDCRSRLATAGACRRTVRLRKRHTERAAPIYRGALVWRPRGNRTHSRPAMDDSAFVHIRKNHLRPLTVARMSDIVRLLAPLLLALPISIAIVSGMMRPMPQADRPQKPR